VRFSVCVICHGAPDECVLSVVVVVRPWLQLVKVDIDVVDVNDNAPIIELAVDALQLYESADIDTELPIGTARDVDSLRHGVDSCRLDSVQCSSCADTSTEALFSLEIRRRFDDVRSVDLYARLISPIDREILGNTLVSIGQSFTRMITQSD